MKHAHQPAKRMARLRAAPAASVGIESQHQWLMNLDAQQVNAPVSTGGRTRLHLAAAGKGLSMLRALLANPHIDVDVRDHAGQTALMQSVGWRVDELLIAAGANLDLADLKGQTALHHCRSAAQCQRLVEAGAKFRQDHTGAWPAWGATVKWWELPELGF